MMNPFLTPAFGRPFAPNSFPEDQPERPTAIQQAEQNAVRGAMADFSRQTARQAFAIALGLLLLSLGAAAFMGLRAIASSQVYYYDQDGNLRATPEEDGISSVIVK